MGKVFNFVFRRKSYKFNAKEQDEETGLYYYGARYYDPRTSVWLSVDPLAEKYPGVSSYVYCLNNPVKFVDPDGRETKDKNQSKIQRLDLLPRDSRQQTLEYKNSDTNSKIQNCGDNGKAEVEYTPEDYYRRTNPWQQFLADPLHWEGGNSHGANDDSFDNMTDQDYAVAGGVVGLVTTGGVALETGVITLTGKELLKKAIPLVLDATMSLSAATTNSKGESGAQQILPKNLRSAVSTVENTYTTFMAIRTPYKLKEIIKSGSETVGAVNNNIGALILLGKIKLQ